MPKSFIVQLGESPFSSSATWKMIWEQQVRICPPSPSRFDINITRHFTSTLVVLKVTIIVTLLTAASKDDLGMLSDAKKFGDFSVALSSEDILPEYTIRTMKVRHTGRFIFGLDMKICGVSVVMHCSSPLPPPQLSKWKSSRRGGKKGRDPSASCVGDRYVSQIIFPHWPEVGYMLTKNLVEMKITFRNPSKVCYFIFVPLFLLPAFTSSSSFRWGLPFRRRTC